MLTGRIFLHLLVVCLSPVVGHIHWDLPTGSLNCFDSEPSLALADCTTALEMIPVGLTLDVNSLSSYGRDPQRPIRLEFDKRPRRLPAMFNVDSCLITVAIKGKPTREQLPDVVGALYFKLWPKAHEAAATVIQRCVSERQATGNMHFLFDVNGFEGQMLVRVYRREGKNPPKGGRRRQKDNYWPSEAYHTVYTPEKIAKAAQRLGRGAVDKVGPSGAGRKRRYGGI